MRLNIDRTPHTWLGWNSLGTVLLAGVTLLSALPTLAQEPPPPTTKSVIRVRPDPPRGAGSGATRSAPSTARSGVRTLPAQPVRPRDGVAVARNTQLNVPATETLPNSEPTILPPGATVMSPRRTVSPHETIVESEGEVIDGPPIPEGYMLELDDGGWNVGFPGGACDQCGGMGCAHCGFVGGVLRGWYIRGDYLNWRTSGMDVPALVTTSPAGTAARSAGVLGQPGTTILFGNDSLNTDNRSGGRMMFGVLLDCEQRLMFEGEFFGLNDATTSYTATSTGSPILARPFFNLLAVQTGGGTLPAESSELVAFPNRIGGTITVDAVSQFQGAAARLRYLLCCSESCLPGMFGFGPTMGGYRMELTGGVRALRLDDSLMITENLSVVPTGTINLFDQFQTENEFVGAEIGMLVQTRRGRFSLDMTSRSSFGNTRGTVDINGQTTTNNGTAITSNGGLLALNSNIGSYQEDQFAVVTELGLTLGYDVTPCWRVLVGYSFIYWSRVLRAGDQIDREIDPNQLPPPPNAPVVSPARPAFEFNWTDFWAQGMTVGLEGRW